MFQKALTVIGFAVILAGCSFPIPGNEKDHLKAARDFRKVKKYKKAHWLYEEFAERYPDSEFKDTAIQRMHEIALDLEKSGDADGAYRLHKEFLNLHPDSPYADTALQRMYEIALSQSASSRGQHRLRDLLERYPASPLAAEAAFQIGKYYRQNGRYEEAILTFKMLILSYPESERVEAAVFLTGESEYGKYEGVEYESEPLSDARKQYELLLTQFQSGAYTQRAEKRLREINAEFARRDYLMALYYVRHGRPGSAEVYLKSIVNQYPETEYAHRASQTLARLKKSKVTEDRGAQGN